MPPHSVQHRPLSVLQKANLPGVQDRAACPGAWHYSWPWGPAISCHCPLVLIVGLSGRLWGKAFSNYNLEIPLQGVAVWPLCLLKEWLVHLMAAVAAAARKTWCQDIASHSAVTASDKNLGAQDGAME